MSNNSQTRPVSLDPKLRLNRADIIAKVRDLSPNLASVDDQVSPIVGTKAEASRRLARLNPAAYGRTRNHLDGAVTGLSPFARHGIMSTADIRDHALDLNTPKESEKLIQQLAWREYWQKLYRENPDYIWTDVEPYKTGFGTEDYADDLPEDIATAKTGVACIDQFITELLTTGYIHNHARLYVAAYICHWRRVKWQVGARFFLMHLLDGDPASNNLSWQWVASTFSHKPYFFNLENVEKFSGESVDTRFKTNKPLAGSYEDIYARLFPNLEPKI